MDEPRNIDDFKSKNVSTRTPFTAEIEWQESLVVFKLHGDLDVDGSQALRNIYESRVQDADLFIVFDMQDVTYINSAGVGAIVALSKAAQMKNGRLFLINARDKIRNIFQITDLDSRLAFVESLDKANRIISGIEQTGND